MLVWPIYQSNPFFTLHSNQHHTPSIVTNLLKIQAPSAEALGAIRALKYKYRVYIYISGPLLYIIDPKCQKGPYNRDPFGNSAVVTPTFYCTSGIHCNRSEPCFGGLIEQRGYEVLPCVAIVSSCTSIGNFGLLPFLLRPKACIHHTVYFNCCHFTAWQWSSFKSVIVLHLHIFKRSALILEINISRSSTKPINRRRNAWD